MVYLRPSGAGRAEGASVFQPPRLPPPLHPPTLSVDVSFFLMHPLKVLFLQEVTKNVHENQQVTTFILIEKLYMESHDCHILTEGFLEVAIESWLEWDLSKLLNSVQTRKSTELSGQIHR